MQSKKDLHFYMHNNKHAEFLKNKKNQNIIIIWQARAACSSVMKMYFNELGLLNDYYLRARTVIHELRNEYTNTPTYIKNKENALNDPNTIYIQFTVNPFRRIVSSYIHQMKYNWLRYEFNDVSFKKYLNNFQKGNYRTHTHQDKQYSYLEGKGKKINYIKMESFHKKQKRFNKKFHLNFELIEKKKQEKINNNKNNSNKNFSEKYIGKIKWSELEHQLPDNYLPFYDNLSKKLVYNLFYDDFKTFNYTWEDFVKEENKK